jgi:hypothetical protein
MLSALPQRAQREAKLFLRLTVKLVTRLNGIANRLFITFTEELGRSPEVCDHLSVYYADILAQKLGKEMDGFYHSVLSNTVGIIHSSYTKWIRENSQEEHPTSHRAIST